MKVTHVLPFFYPEAIAGTETYCLSLCKFLQQKGVECEVLIPNYHNNTFKEYFFDGVRVIKYPEPGEESHLGRMGLDIPKGINAYKDYIKKSNPDCVHFHAIYGSTGITVQHIVETKALGFTTIYTMHVPGHVCRTNTLVRKQKELCDGKIRNKTCASCSIVHLNKPEWMGNLLANGGEVMYSLGIDSAYWNNPLGTALSMTRRIREFRTNLFILAENCNKICILSQWFFKVMLKNGVDEEKMKYIAPGMPYVKEDEVKSQTLKFNFPNSIKIIFAGRLSAQKGLDMVLKTLQNFPEDKIELSIYGKEDSKEFLQECQHLSAGKKNIHWRGVLSRSEILNAFRQHDLFCLPSILSEMSPLSIQEAFEAGIPVIASKVYGNMELITHMKNGLLFNFKSAEDFELQLKLLINDPSVLPMLKSNILPPRRFKEVGEEYLNLYNAELKKSSYLLNEMA